MILRQDRNSKRNEIIEMCQFGYKTARLVGCPGDTKLLHPLIAVVFRDVNIQTPRYRIINSSHILLNALSLIAFGPLLAPSIRSKHYLLG